MTDVILSMTYQDEGFSQTDTADNILCIPVEKETYLELYNKPVSNKMDFKLL